MRAVDLFAGAGGFSTGAKLAGCDVVWAADHWPAAVAIHAANHPHTAHACQDLQQTDWTTVPAHDLLLASPACQGHSKARGKEKPHHDALRSTAWAVVSAIECHRPEAALVENVVEFRDWDLFPSWLDALKRLGYAAALNVLCASDAGVPQERRRLFVSLVKGSTPLQLNLPRVEPGTARGVIQFDRGHWTPVDKPGRSEATLRRIANGRRQFGDRFVMPYYSGGSGLTGRSLDRPIGTITTKNRWGVVDGNRMRMLLADESRDFMGFPQDYVLPMGVTEATFMLGNAVCPPQAAQAINYVKERA